MTDRDDLEALDASPPETAVAPDVAEEPNAGVRMFDSIARWVESATGDELPTVVSRFVVIAECNDSEGRWIARCSLTADGNELADWESIGLLEYARIHETRNMTAGLYEGEADDE